MFDAPDAREIEDGALSFALEDGGAVGTLVHTFTEHGRAVAEAGRDSSSWFAESAGDRTFDIRWSFAFQPALEAATIPDWMASRNAEAIADDIRLTAEPWGWAMVFLTYPTGAAKWLHNHTPTDARPFESLDWVRGIMALDVEMRSSKNSSAETASDETSEGHPSFAGQLRFDHVADLLASIGLPDTERVARWLRPFGTVDARISSNADARVARALVAAQHRRQIENPETFDDLVGAERGPRLFSRLSLGPA